MSITKALPLLGQKRIEYGFERTTCGCDACSRFCSYMPGPLSPLDLEQMTRAAGFDDRLIYAEQFLTASPGAVIGSGGALVRIPTLIPRALDSGACIHFIDGRCAIHAISPFGCAFVDEHQSGDEADERMHYLFSLLLADRRQNGVYWQTWLHLWQRGQRGPDQWPAARTKWIQRAMHAVAHGSDRERAGALSVLTLLTSGRMQGELP